LEHETGRHPERPERLVQVTAHLRRTGLDAKCRIRPVRAATDAELARCHPVEYVRQVEAACREGGGRIEEDTVVSTGSAAAARLAVGAAIDAVERVVRGEAKNALVLSRPPGHHALKEAAMGFCLYGNVALAARAALEAGRLNRVLVVDWDVHHGNGTQDLLWEEPRAGFLSIHRWPFYPGTGREDETGGIGAEGTKANVPIEYGTSRRSFLDRFRMAFDKLVARMRPELVLFSAGFDAHRDDPVGSLGLETEDYGPLTDHVLDAAETYAGGRVVSVLEGGYNTGVLAGCVALHLERLLARDGATDHEAGEAAKDGT
jgi:acetoin utilization deacetylase AcuC-like enzyme